MNQYQYYQCKKRGCGNAVREDTANLGNGCSCHQSTGSGSGCGCGCDGGQNGRSLAMVYAPKQCFRSLYSETDALMHGTLFEELYLPILTAGGNGR